MLVPRQLTRRQLVGGSLVGLLLLSLAALARRLLSYGALRYDNALVLSAREARSFSAIAEALFPGGNGFPAAAEMDCTRYFDRHIASLGEGYRGRIMAGFLLLEHAPIYFGYLGRCSDLPLEDRIAYLERLSHSNTTFRSLLAGLRTFANFAYWRDERTLSQISVYRKCPQWTRSMADEAPWTPVMKP